MLGWAARVSIRAPKGSLWNPPRAPLEEALLAPGAPAGVLAVMGGAEAYELFLERRLRCLLPLARGQRSLARRRPVFQQVGPNRTPEDVLSEVMAFAPGESKVLQPDAGATLVTWVP